MTCYLNMRSWVTTIGCVLVLAACGDSTPDEQTAPQNKIVVQGPGQRQMHELGELNRAIALKRAISDSGFTCKRITRSGYSREYDNLSMWVAHCADERSWAVFIAPDDQVQVRNCADHAELKLPECRIDWNKTKA
jgi:hypothetical protein